MIRLSGDTGKGSFWSRPLATRAFRVLPPVGRVPVSLLAGDFPCCFRLLRHFLLCSSVNEGSVPDDHPYALMVSIFLSREAYFG